MSEMSEKQTRENQMKLVEEAAEHAATAWKRVLDAAPVEMTKALVLSLAMLTKAMEEATSWAELATKTAKAEETTRAIETASEATNTRAKTETEEDEGADK